MGAITPWVNALPAGATLPASSSRGVGDETDHSVIALSVDQLGDRSTDHGTVGYIAAFDQGCGLDATQVTVGGRVDVQLSSAQRPVIVRGRLRDALLLLGGSGGRMSRLWRLFWLPDVDHNGI